MKLQKLLENIDVIQVHGDNDVNVSTLSQDSREITKIGTLYVAVKGDSLDGHDYINDAIVAGASVVVCESLPPEISTEVTYVRVTHSQKSVGIIAGNFYGNPSRDIEVIAVTGTNGKTSVATYISQILNINNKKPLLLSTAGDYFCGDEIRVAKQASSSVEIIELQKKMREYVDAGATHCCLEATSHGLDQERLSGIDINVAIFTNLTQDHLDYHETFEHYAESKKKLFDMLSTSAYAIINGDDAYSEKMIADTHARVVRYGQKKDANYILEILYSSIEGTEILLNQNSVVVPLVGDFNMMNTSAVYAYMIESGIGSIKDLHQLVGSPGRMQRIENDKGILVLVDYAHTPDALENVLQTLTSIPHTSIITVIGCGGDRDRVKRPLMSAGSQKYSNLSIFTSDNPRTESLDQIFDDMKSGLSDNGHEYIFIRSREEAIKYAIASAETDSIVLIAGKGHEDYQIIGTEKNYFDDRVTAEKYLV